MATFWRESLLAAVTGTVCAVVLSVGIWIEHHFFFREIWGDAATLSVLDSRVEARDKARVVLGRVQNDGDHAVQSIVLQADFFDADDRIVDVCKGYYTSSVRPRESVYFKVTCHDEDAPLPPYTKYVVHPAVR